MTAPSLNVGDSVREVCAVCGEPHWCRSNFVLYPNAHNAPSCMSPPARPAPHFIPAVLIPQLTWQRIAELARAVEDPTNSEPLRQLLAAIKESAT